MRNTTQEAIDAQKAAAQKEYDSWVWFFAFVLGGAGLFFFIASTCLSQYETQRAYLYLDAHHKGKAASPLISCTKSLIKSDKVIPLYIRYGVPLVLVVNAGLFLSGHIQLGATVDLLIQLAGEQMEIPAFFVFSIANSTIDMWKAGATALAIIIALFSGLWPYTKLGITMFLWCAPPTWFAPSSRGNTFLWLDALGKWSMIDIFVLVMSMIAFRITVRPVVSRSIASQSFMVSTIYCVCEA